MNKKAGVMEGKIIIIIIALALFFAMISIYLLVQKGILDIDVLGGVFP